MYNQLPNDTCTSIIVKQKVNRYFMKDGQLLEKCLQGESMNWLGPSKIEEVLKEIHIGDCGSHMEVR